MTVCLDTGVLDAEHDLDATRHDEASTALEAVYDGDFGHPYISDYIYDETVTLTLKRSQSFPPAEKLGQKLRGVDPYPQTYELIRVSAAVFADAVDIFEQYNDQALSFTDATTVALCRRHKIDVIMSFDDDFDGVIESRSKNSVNADQYHIRQWKHTVLLHRPRVVTPHSAQRGTLNTALATDTTATTVEK